MKETAEQAAKQAQIRLREQEYKQTMKECIAIVIDSWDNLDCPDERRAIKRYLNDYEFFRKVNSMWAQLSKPEMTFEFFKSKINSPEEYAMYSESTVKAAWSYQQERINLLEQRVIDLQGHNDLSYLDKKLSEQEGELSMTVPEGYAIVPIEPTKSMIDAGLGADSDAFPLKYIYQAMIEAAQEGE